MKTEKSRIGKSYFYACIWFVFLVAADQLTKYQAVTHFKNKKPFVLIPGVFELRYLENGGCIWHVSGKTIHLPDRGACGMSGCGIFLQEDSFRKTLFPAAILCGITLLGGSRKYDRPAFPELCRGLFLF